jgi:hypothetical protein
VLFSNTLGATNRAAQRKALVAPLKEEFDGKPEDVLRHIADFNHCCKEVGVIEDFKVIIKENTPPSKLDLSDPIDQATWHSDPDHQATWHSDPDHFVYRNVLIDSSQPSYY